jgi:hypothetical protein
MTYNSDGLDRLIEGVMFQWEKDISNFHLYWHRVREKVPLRYATIRHLKSCQERKEKYKIGQNF